MSDSPHMEVDAGRGRSKSDSPARERSASRGRSRSANGEADRRGGERRGDRDGESSSQIYIAKLHRNTKESDLREAFSKFGKIKEVILKHNYAFIGYDDAEAATQAIKEMDGKAFVNGEELVVEQSGRE